MNSSSMIRKRLIFLLWFVFCLGMILFLFQSFQLRSDLSFFLPQKTDAIDQVMRHQLTQGEAGKIILIALRLKNKQNNQAAPTRLLADLNKKLTAVLKIQKEFTQVHNGQSSLSELLIEPYFTYRYLLNDKPESFSQKNLKHSFLQLLQRIQFIMSATEQRLMSEDPQMIWLTLLKRWQHQTLQKHHGVWFDHNAEQALLFVKTRANAYDLIQQKKNIALIENNLSELIQSSKSLGDYTIEPLLSGAPVFALSSKKSISLQIKLISVLASITLMAFLFWFFRSIITVFLISLPLSLAVLSGISSVILVDGFIHGITMAFGITIIGVAVDYPIHYFSHARYMPRQLAAHSIWPMLRLGLITTIIGFSAILLSDFSGLRQLGIFAISGLITAAFCTRTLLPLLSINPGKHTANSGAYNKLLFLVKLPIHPAIKKIMMLLPLLAIIAISLNYQHLWQKDLAALSPIPEKLKQQDFNLRKAMGLPELRYTLLITADTIEELLQQSEQLKPELKHLVKKKMISAYDMAAHYLPSRQQQSNIQQTLPDEKQLEKLLLDTLQETELNAQAFTPFIQALKNSRQLIPLTREQLLNSNKDNFINDKIRTLLFKNDNGLWTALIPLQGVTTETIADIDMSPAQLLDLKAQTESLLSHYRNEAIAWFLAGLVLILLVLFFHHRQLHSVWTLAAPFSAAITITIATLLMAGFSLSIFHLVTLLLVVGLGIDYSIFSFKSCTKSENALQFHEISQVSVIICAISTLIMFASLSLSDLPVLKAIGLTASLGAFFAFLYTFIFSRSNVLNEPILSHPDESNHTLNN